MFSIHVICLVSFHYLRRRRLRRFYANRRQRRGRGVGGRYEATRGTGEALRRVPRPFSSLFGSGFPEQVSYCSSASIIVVLYPSSPFFFSLYALSVRSPSPSVPPSFTVVVLVVVVIIVIITIATKILSFSPSRSGTRRINIIHNSFHFFGVH